MFNEAHSTEAAIEAAELMERNDYIRYSEKIVQAVDRSVGSLEPTDLEKEYVYYTIAYGAVVNGKMDIARIYMRKLFELPKRHNFSEYVIAYIQHRDGQPYNEFKVSIPKNSTNWYFYVGFNGADSVVIDDVRSEYDVSYRFDSLPTIMLKTLCVFCIPGINLKDEVVLAGLENGVFRVSYSTK